MAVGRLESFQGQCVSRLIEFHDYSLRFGEFCGHRLHEQRIKFEPLPLEVNKAGIWRSALFRKKTKFVLKIVLRDFYPTALNMPIFHRPNLDAVRKVGINQAQGRGRRKLQNWFPRLRDGVWGRDFSRERLLL